MKPLAFALIILPLLTWAVENGSPLAWAKNDDIVYEYCTGTVLGGRWVLSASHCEHNFSNGIHTYLDGVRDIQRIHRYPDDEANGEPTEIDMTLSALASPINTTHMRFLSGRNVLAGEIIKLVGFGGSFPRLQHANLINQSMATTGVAPWLYLRSIGQGNNVAGDSGAPYVDANGFIVGIHTAGGGNDIDGYIAEGMRLSVVSKWILEIINGWHYPTQAYTDNGTVTIKVQSLHRDTVADNAYTLGDATLTGGTCIGAIIAPYDVCTYQLASNGDEGTLILNATPNALPQMMTINSRTLSHIPRIDEPPTLGSTSGGTLGIFVLLLMGFVRVLRR